MGKVTSTANSKKNPTDSMTAKPKTVTFAGDKEAINMRIFFLELASQSQLQ